MASGPSPLHIYQRDIAAGERNSLTVLATHIPPGARALDLGCGSGALGRFLTAAEPGGDVTLDGLTINPDEARLAAQHYRHIEVANLETCELTRLFAPAGYDAIICADVLEHIRHPQRVLASCRALLAPGGRVLLSIPNTGYAGLIAELMAGEFRYRPEGLLDETHLRFFTRQTLMRFLAAERWVVASIETVERELPDSEFRVAFDALPPAVARHLLALPDALSYQFIVSCRPAAPGEAIAIPEVEPPLPAQAHFSAQLYWDEDQGFAETRKCVASGVIGSEKQTLRFVLPHQLTGLKRLKLDPADRPGILYLYALRLLCTDQEQPLWDWNAQDPDAAAPMQGAPAHQVVWGSQLHGHAAAAALLTGDDPWIQLPIDDATLARAAARETLVVEAVLGWPMSADYLHLASVIGPLQTEQQFLREQVERTVAIAQDHEKLALEHTDLHRQHTDLRRRHDNLHRRHADLREEHAQMAAAATQQSVEHTRLSAQIDDLASQNNQLSAENADLSAEVADLSAENADLSAKNTALSAETVRQSAQIVEWSTRDAHRPDEAALLAARNEQAQRQIDHLHQQLQGMAEHVHNLQNLRAVRYTRPLAELRNRLIGRPSSPLPPVPQAAAPAPLPIPAPRSAVVDIIVPVYRGLADTQLCLQSVLASPLATNWRLIVINDCSPEPELTDWLRALAAAEPRITLLENEHNVGFVGTVNRGMAQSQDNDVLLLNSDTEVANDWLDRLRRCAYAQARVGSATPFSGNATICSYPVFCADNPLPPGHTTASLDQLFAQANAGQSVEVPTGVGFCMYIRRDALQAIGLFDEARFGKGYGEENDFCQRAIALGWVNLHALDTYVRHTGGVSFGDSKSPRELAAMDTLSRLHPGYEAQVHGFLQADPARTARLAVDWLCHTDGGRKPVILAVHHARGGGTERHVLELAAHLADSALFLSLQPTGAHRVLLRLIETRDGHAAFSERWSTQFDLAHEQDGLLQLLRAMPVAHIHYHHLLGHSPFVWTLAQELGVRYDFTAHDFYSRCTHITLTGKGGRYQADERGECCGGHHPDSLPEVQEDIHAWRARNQRFLQQARFVLAPSLDAAHRIHQDAPEAPVRFAPHTEIDPAQLPTPHPALLPTDRPLRIAVIGALSAIKGADVLEDTARLARKAGAPLEFQLIGFGYRHLQTAPATALTKVHGQYAEADLPAMLQRIAPDLVWFPALWPETYSYTLSAALLAGLPVAVPDLGAFVERVAGRPWSWVQPWDSSTQAWVDFFTHIRQQCFVANQVEHAGPLPPALAAFGAALPTWDYRADYLAFPHRAAPEQVAAHARHVADRFATPQPMPPANAPGAKALGTLARLRALPALAPVARAIPARWQARVKGWLLR